MNPIASNRYNNGISRAGASGKTMLGPKQHIGCKLLESLVDWWPLNEPAGIRVGMHRGYRLSPSSSSPGMTGGVDGACATFASASSQYLTATSISQLQAGNVDFSLSAWIYMTDKSASKTFISKGGSDTSREFLLQYVQSSDRLRFIVYDGGSGIIGIVTADYFGSPPLNTWMFVVACHTATYNFVSLRVNDGPETVVNRTGTAGTNSSNFNIGVSNTPNFQYWDGRIQSVGYWKRRIVWEEGVQLYAGGRGMRYPFTRYVSPCHLLKKDLVDWWQLDETSGDRAGSHAGKTLTDINTVTSGTGINGTTAGLFTAANSEYLVRTSEAALQVGDIAFEVSAWVKLNSLVEGAIVSKYDTNNKREFYLTYDPTVGHFAFMVTSDGGSTNFIRVYDTATVATGTWYFLRAGHDPVGNLIYLTVDEARINTTPWTLGAYTGTSPFAIGARFTAGVADKFFDGYIQKVGFWKRILNPVDSGRLINPNPAGGTGRGVTYSNM